MTKKKSETTKKKLTKAQLEQALLDNFLGLQRVLTNLSVKFDDLSNNMSKILQLFEIAAKSFAEKSPEGIKQNDKDLLDKLDSLLDQNKVISKGIMMMEERIRNKTQGAEPERRYQENFRPRPLPRF